MINIHKSLRDLCRILYNVIGVIIIIIMQGTIE